MERHQLVLLFSAAICNLNRKNDLYIAINKKMLLENVKFI